MISKGKKFGGNYVISSKEFTDERVAQNLIYEDHKFSFREYHLDFHITEIVRLVQNHAISNF